MSYKYYILYILWMVKVLEKTLLCLNACLKCFSLVSHGPMRFRFLETVNVHPVQNINKNILYACKPSAIIDTYFDSQPLLIFFVLSE